jgi:hypothetical protein
MAERRLYEHERLYQARRDAADDLYEALEVFAKFAERMEGQGTDDDGLNTLHVTLGDCRKAQVALARACGEKP